MTIKKRNCCKSMLRKGVYEDKTRTHRVFTYCMSGSGVKSGVSTVMSHGTLGDDLPDALIGRMAKQCAGLSNKQFLRFVSCDMTREEFEEHVLAYELKPDKLLE